MARKREQEEAEAARRQEEAAVISGLQVELRALQGTDPGMSLLTAVEFVTYDPARRVALYRLCSPLDRGISGLAQADAKIASCLLSGDCCGERINDIRFAGDSAADLTADTTRLTCQS